MALPPQLLPVCFIAAGKGWENWKWKEVEWSHCIRVAPAAYPSFRAVKHMGWGVRELRQGGLMHSKSTRDPVQKGGGEE